jgi:fructokinase
VIAVVGEARIDAHLAGGVLRLFPGGGPFNSAVALAHLGVPVCFCGALSRDQVGRFLEERLGSADVVTSECRVDAPKPIAIVDGDRREPSYNFHLATTAHEALQPPDLRDLPHAVIAVHVGTLARGSLDLSAA